MVVCPNVRAGRKNGFALNADGGCKMYKLIIIDDEEKIASGMAQLFPWQNIGFEVVQVFTGARKALQYIAENPVDVVLTDIEMPDMNGLELSQRLMEYPNIQKIFFSSSSNYEYFRAALLLVAVTTYMTLVTQMHRMTQDNERGIEAVRSNISLVLDSVLAQNSYMTGMTRTNMVLNKALKRESLSYTDAIYLRSLVSSLNSMTNAYDYVDSVLIYMDGYDRALTSSGLVNLSADDYSGWYSVYSSMSDTERTCIAPVVVNAGKASERRQLVVCARMLTMEGCVAVTLNISHLQEIIAVLRPSDNQHLYLVDGSGRLLAKAGDAGATEELQNLMGKTLSGAGNTAEPEHEFWIKLDDRVCLLNWQSYQNPDFYIVSTIDQAMILENLGERLMPLLLMAVVALCAIVFLAYVNTKRSFDEINLMLQMFEDAEAGRTIQRPQRKVNDEYDVIMNNILMMFLNNTYLNIQLKEKQYRQQNAELTALQLQINPHFLYNTLQTLDMEARKLNDDGRISAVVGYVSDILKYSLTNPQKSVSLREELDYLKKYVEVQHYRFGDRFIIYYEVDDDVMDAEVFRLMLQPVVENSLLHALRGNERGYMKVRARRIGDKVNLRVIDNGDGMTREELEALRKRIADRNSRSIGLTNLDRRLRLRYPEETGLRICSIKNLGTSVSFCIPYKKYTPDAPQTGKTE